MEGGWPERLPCTMTSARYGMPQAVRYAAEGLGRRRPASGFRSGTVNTTSGGHRTAELAGAICRRAGAPRWQLPHRGAIAAAQEDPDPGGPLALRRIPLRRAHRHARARPVAPGRLLAGTDSADSPRPLPGVFRPFLLYALLDDKVADAEIRAARRRTGPVSELTGSALSRLDVIACTW